jgi:hypothetical protein
MQSPPTACFSALNRSDDGSYEIRIFFSHFFGGGGCWADLEIRPSSSCFQACPTVEADKASKDITRPKKMQATRRLRAREIRAF